MDLNPGNFLLLLLTLAGAHNLSAASVEVLARVAMTYKYLFDTTEELFAILAGPEVSAPKRLHKFFNALDDVTLAALKARQTAMLSSAFIDEEQLKKNIYSALLAADGRLARELIGKLISFHVLLRPRDGDRLAKRSLALRQFFTDLAKKKLASHNPFMDALVKVYQPRLGTLAYAIDTTGSMHEDIATAVYLTKSITISHKDTPTSYVLAPFNDPGITESMNWN
jgi:hypothetical protein